MGQRAIFATYTESTLKITTVQWSTKIAKSLCEVAKTTNEDLFFQTLFRAFQTINLYEHISCMDVYEKTDEEEDIEGELGYSEIKIFLPFGEKFFLNLSSPCFSYSGSESISDISFEKALSLISHHYHNQDGISILATPTELYFFSDGLPVDCWFDVDEDEPSNMSKELFLDITRPCPKLQAICPELIGVFSKDTIRKIQSQQFFLEKQEEIKQKTKGRIEKQWFNMDICYKDMLIDAQKRNAFTDFVISEKKKEIHFEIAANDIRQGAWFQFEEGKEEGSEYPQLCYYDEKGNLQCEYEYVTDYINRILKTVTPKHLSYEEAWELAQKSLDDPQPGEISALASKLFRKELL